MKQIVIDFLSEFLGTFILAYVIFTTGNFLAIGGIFGLLVLLTQKYSIASFNPAVSIAMFYNKKFNEQTLLAVIVAEILGALLTIPLINMK